MELDDVPTRRDMAQLAERRALAVELRRAARAQIFIRPTRSPNALLAASIAFASDAPASDPPPASASSIASAGLIRRRRTGAIENDRVRRELIGLREQPRCIAEITSVFGARPLS
jgi:hypothetical protein